MPRQTPITYLNTSLTNTNSTIAGISTGYALAFTTSNLTVASSFLMSNATPAIHQAAFYSTTITVVRGDMSLSNTVFNNAGVLEPDGTLSLNNTHFVASNAGIAIVNNPYDPVVDGNAYSSNLNNLLLNTNLVLTTTDSGGNIESAIRYGGIGFGCNSPSYPIDMSINPSYSPGTVYHGAAISLNEAGIKINSDQLGQISVTTPGEVAEATFNTTNVGGPLMAYGSGSATRGGYIFATSGDAINIAGTGQVSICNAGVAQTNYSLFVGGDTGVQGSMEIINYSTTIAAARLYSTNLQIYTGNLSINEGQVFVQNSMTRYITTYSTSLNMYNGNIILSNANRGEIQMINTDLIMQSGDIYVNRLSTATANASFYSTDINTYNSKVQLNNTIPNAIAFQLCNSVATYAIMNSTILSMSVGQIDINNANMYINEGSFTQSNTSLGYHDLYSTSLRIYNASTLHSNLTQHTAQFFCTNMQIYAGDFLISSTSATQRSATLNGTNLVVNSGNVTFRSTFTMSNSAGTIAANLYSTNVTMFGGNFTQCNRATGTAIYQSTNMTIFNGSFTMCNNTTQNAFFTSTTIRLCNADLYMGDRQTQFMNLGSTVFSINSGDVGIRNSPILFSNATTRNFNLISTNVNLSTGNLTLRNGDFNMSNNTTQNADFYSTNMTIRNANFTLSNTASVTAVATFYSTQVTVLNGGFIQSNTTGALATALFYSTSMTVYGPISTTETFYCLGRFNSPNVGNISTLILGNNIASTAKTSLDVNGSYRTRVQVYSTTGNTVAVNGGNLVFFSSATNSVLYLPITNAVETGMLYTMHSESPGTMYVSTLGGDLLNNGTTPLAIGKNQALVSIMCLGSGAWHAIVSG